MIRVHRLRGLTGKPGEALDENGIELVQIARGRIRARGRILQRPLEPFEARELRKLPCVRQASGVTTVTPGEKLYECVLARQRRRVGQELLRHVEPVLKGPVRLVHYEVAQQAPVTAVILELLRVPLRLLRELVAEHIREVPEYLCGGLDGTGKREHVG